MRVVYEGPSQARVVPLAGVVAKRGEPVEVPAAIGRALIARPDYREHAPRARSNGGKGSRRRRTETEG